MACGILVPWPGIKLTPCTESVESYSVDHQGSPYTFKILNHVNILMIWKKNEIIKSGLSEAWACEGAWGLQIWTLSRALLQIKWMLCLRIHPGSRGWLLGQIITHTHTHTHPKHKLSEAVQSAFILRTDVSTVTASNGRVMEVQWVQ